MKFSVVDELVREVFDCFFELDHRGPLVVCHQIFISDSENLHLRLGPHTKIHFLLHDEVDLVNHTTWLHQSV